MKASLAGMLDALDLRLQDARAGDRDLDCALHVELFSWKLAKVPADYDGLNECEVWRDPARDYDGIDRLVYPARGKLSPFFHVPTTGYTSSMDGALKLLRGVLPTWHWRAGEGSIPQWIRGRAVHGWCHLNRVHPDHCDRHDEATGWAETAPLSVCLAIVRAQIAQRDHKRRLDEERAARVKTP